MAKKSFITNTLWFVSHPYAAPPSSDVDGNICLWNKGQTPHHRKLLMSQDATVIDNYDYALEGQEITFIGEWECCSSFVANSNKSPFNRTHLPIHSQHDASINCKNTDPYVFGKEFYWICCKQPKDKSRIQIGDIVLFGSYTLKNLKVDKMVIDTVLVVDEVIKEIDFKNSRFSQCYHDVTLAHTTNYCLVVGKMYDPSKSYDENVPFSFVPCRREGLMDKLVLDRRIPIPELKGDPIKIGQNCGHVDLDDNVRAWEKIVAHIRAEGCELGVYMPEPAPTTNNSIINNHSKSIISKQNEKDTTTCSGGCSGSRC